MIHNKGEISSSFGTAIVIVLCMLIFASFSNKSIASIDSNLRYELKTGFHTDQVKANVAADVKLPLVEESSVLLLHNIFNNTYKVIAKDKTYIQGFIALQKTYLSIEPITFCRFYYHFFSKDADDLPVYC
jgi:hypothetical protein